MRRCLGWEEGCPGASLHRVTAGARFCPVCLPTSQRRRPNSFWARSSGLRGPRVEPLNGSLPLLVRGLPTDAACTARSTPKTPPGPPAKRAAAPRYLRERRVARPSEGEGSQHLQDTPTKSNGWASPIFFVPRTLRRTWGTRPVRVVISEARSNPTSREKRARYGAPRDSWHDKGANQMVFG
jgi:hypothetical protein